MASASSIAENAPKTKRSWFRFSLRTFFIVVTLICVFVGWKVVPVLEQMRAVGELKRDNTFLTYQYDYQLRYYRGDEKGKPPPEPAWLARIFGVDFVHDVVKVQLIGKGTADHPQWSFSQQDFKQALPALKYLPRLQSLDITANTASFEDRDFASLEKLHRLDELRIFGGRLGNGALQYIRNLTELETLVLENNRIDDEGLAHLANLKNLKTLDLYGNQISGPGLRHLANLVNLEELILGKNQITGEGLQYIAKLPKLRMLILDDNPITDDDLKSIAGLPNLEVWSLANTRLTDASIGTLAKLHITPRFDERTPVEFYLSNTAITPEGFKRLQQSRKEAVIFIQGKGFNDFSGITPAQFTLPEE